MALRATYSGVGPYRGVVKDEKGHIVAQCEHLHRNRDTGSMFAGPPARSCALRLLAELDPAAAVAAMPAFMRERQ